jgi:serine/threonine-protein kinase
MPEALGPYRIVDVLGEGGMGVVYAAEDQRLGRTVAVKTLNESNQMSRDRLLREARAAAALNHPGICQVFDVGEEDGELWVAMELLEGESLLDRLKRERLRVREAVQIASDILTPLAFLHTRGMIHRDLKPSNIFLTPHGVKLLDFSLTRPVEGPRDTRLTAEGMIVGTPHYMAPEQWRGAEVGPHTDLFACGAILYEMLAGQFAFPGEDPITVAHAVTFEEPAPLRGSMGIELLDGVVQRALEKKPEDRYESALEMATDLSAALERGSTTTGSADSVEFAIGSAGSGGLAVGSAESVGLGESGGFRRPTLSTGSNLSRGSTLSTDSGVSRGGEAAERILRFIVLPFRLLRPDPETEFLATSLPEAISASLAGLDHLTVRSTSLAEATSGDVDLKKLAEDVEVDYALQGSILSAGSRVRLNAQLVEVPKGTVVWTLQEDVPLGDLFELQDDLTHKVVEGLALPLSPREEARLEHDAPANPRAYELYLRALHAAEQGITRSSMMAVRDLYRSCLDEDPEFAPAWARYGRVCRIISKYALGDTGEHLELAERAFERAFELNPDSPLIHNYYTFFELEEIGDSIGALRRLLGRVRDRSSDANLYTGLVAACRFCGLYEASLAANDKAHQLDPTQETSVHHTYFLLGRKEEVEGRDLLHALLGEAPEAIEILRSPEVRETEGTVRMYADCVLAALEERASDCEGAFRAAVDRGLRDPEHTFYFARALSMADLGSLALETMERVVDRGFYCGRSLREDPWFESLRAEGGFDALLTRADEGRAAAAAAYREAGGEELLGVDEK